MDDLSKLDLNLLLVFASVMKTRSATRAGDELDITQSAISNALRRLRAHFDDPLFVKTPQGMSPTPLAERLAEPLNEALEGIRAALAAAAPFNPAVSERAFRIYMSDLGQMVLMPRLVRYIEQHAPRVRLAVVDVSPKNAQGLMSEGAIDLAIGTFDTFQAGFHSQRLFKKSYVVIARKGHPALAGGLTLDRFLSASHGVYHPPANSHDDFEDVLSQVFHAHGVRRRVAFEFAHGLGIVETVAESDMLMCVPQRLAHGLAASDRIDTAPLPFESPSFDVSQFWHERNHVDDAHRWLRSLVYRHYSGMEQPVVS